MWGLLGILPFVLLVFLVVRMIVQVCAWMRETSNPYHCAIPLAMVLLAGLVHAFFEDWLTSVGYYLCLFFWTLAFLLRDMMPATSPLRIPRHRRRTPGSPLIPPKR
jgi:O-antigen ligase